MPRIRPRPPRLYQIVLISFVGGISVGLTFGLKDRPDFLGLLPGIVCLVIGIGFALRTKLTSRVWAACGVFAIATVMTLFGGREIRRQTEAQMQRDDAASGETAVVREAPSLVPDPPLVCAKCEEWNQPREPFEVFGNTYFVGTQGLSSVLVDTGMGLILFDVPLPQSAPLVEANIRSLGFKPTDVKYIFTSHGHYDHVGGIAAMQRFTGATVLTSASTGRSLELGHPVPEDPQYSDGADVRFPSLTTGLSVVKDGEAITLGAVRVTAHYTPGHTPGATSWTWRSCEGARCLNMVYVDSLTSISNDTFRYTDVPGLVESFRDSIGKVAVLPCDIVISTHPSATDLDDRLKRRGKLTPGDAGDPLVDPNACKALADRSLKALDQRVAKEQSAPR